MKTLWELLKHSYNQWSDDEPFQLSATLAYYTFFSLAPLLVISIALAGFFFGEEAARHQIVGSLQGILGEDSARAIEEVIRNSSHKEQGLLATILGLVTLLLGASGVVGQLQNSLNRIWGVKPKGGRGWRGLIVDRLLSMALVVSIGFLLVVSLIMTAGLSAALTYLKGYIPGPAPLWHTAELAISLVVIAFLFAFIYKFLPDVRIAWKDALVGGMVTSALFTIGKFLIGLYLGRLGTTSAFGAAGSLVVLLLWVNYSGLIFFFGAEFTEVYANRFGHGLRPGKKAVPAAESAAGPYSLARRAFNPARNRRRHPAVR